MTDRWKRFALAAFLLGALLFIMLALQGQWSAFAELGGSTTASRIARPEWLLAAVGLGTLNLLGMAALWTWLARRWGEDIRYPEGMAAWIGSNLGRYIPGKVWQLAGLAAFMRGTGRSGSVGLVSALVFQIVVLVSGIAAALLTLGNRIGDAFGGSLLLPVGLAVVLSLILHPGILRRATAALAKLLREHGSTVPSVIEPERPTDRAYSWLLGVALLVAWWVYGAGFWFLVAGVSEAPVSDIRTLTGVFAASYVAGYLSMVTPGGLIVREGAMTVLLAAATPLPAAAAVGIALLARLWTIVSELAAFGIAVLLRGGLGKGGMHPDDA
ncbi:MAG: lysylphosphatidylglycerol synthase domain-containing protein [Gemmatimonadales bacterium]